MARSEKVVVETVKRKSRKKGKKNRKHGRKKRSPAFGRWKDRFNRGAGLKHRRMKKRMRAV